MPETPQKKSGSTLRRFLTEEIWEIEEKSLSLLKRIGLYALKVLQLVVNGFWKNHCPLHASALTYTTLVSFVPVMAMALAVLRGMGAGEFAERKIMTSISAMPAEFQQFIADMFGYVKKTDFMTLGGLGMLFLLFIVVQMLSQVEMAFNMIWGVPVSRNIMRKIADYISVMVLVPVLILTATTLRATFISVMFQNLLLTRFSVAAEMYSHLLKLMPLAAAWCAFVVLYKFMPNTKVRFWPALASGVVGGSLWMGWQWLYITFQIGVANYNKIYATFASVFIFLIWVYISWLIVLLGAEIGFALQNHKTYGLEQKAHNAGIRARFLLALTVLKEAAKSLTGGAPAFNAETFSRQYTVPVRLLNEVLEQLIAAGFLARTAESASEFVLRRAADRITAEDVYSAFVSAGADAQSLGLDKIDPGVWAAAEEMHKDSAAALRRRTVAELLNSSPAAHDPTPLPNGRT